jgi:hypothetical protein
MSIEEAAADCLFLSLPGRVPTFIFDLISNAKAGSNDFRILSKDEIFMQALKATKMNFDKQYKMISKEQKLQR